MLDTDMDEWIGAERRKLADDFHDIIGYTLTTAIVQIDAIRRLMACNPELGIQKLDSLRDFIHLELNDIRHSVKSLNGMSGNFDLADALRRLIETTRESTGMEMTAAIPLSLPSLSNDQKEAIYNVVREGLTNGIRHGRCTRSALSLSLKGDSLELVLSNDGKPYEETAPGVGLMAMQRRVGTLGGSVYITSSAEEGCRLQVSIPL